MTPTIHSPLALLFAKIKAEMVANGTPFADSPAETAFRTWLQAAWLDSGCTQEFACLYQPATSTTVSISAKAADGHRANVWWGDGTTDNYVLNASSTTTIAKTYASAALRPIVVLGKITLWDSVGQSFGGRIWAHLRSLTYLSCWSCQLLSGDIANLPAGLTSLDCGGCPLLRGDIANLPAGLTYLSCWSCPLLSGDIANLPAGLTYINCWGCQLLYTGAKVWPSGVRVVVVGHPTPGVFTSGMTDALIIDTSTTAWTGEKTLDIRGNCGSPTAAADAAVDSLIAQGVTVLTN